MMFPDPRRQRLAAFTLLEVMLAVIILGLLITSVITIWNAALGGWKRGANVSENFQRERVVMATLADLSKSVIYFPSTTGLYDINYNHNPQEGDTLSFVTGSDLLLPPAETSAAGMRRVTVGLQHDQYGRTYLGISNSTALETDQAPPPVMHVLSAEVCGFSVRFRDPHDGSWKDKWDTDENVMPSALEYTLGFGANDGRTPPVVITRTVELPTAQYVLQLLGQTQSANDTTNTVTRQNIDLSSGANGGTSPQAATP